MRPTHGGPCSCQGDGYLNGVEGGARRPCQGKDIAPIGIDDEETGIRGEFSAGSAAFHQREEDRSPVAVEDAATIGMPSRTEWRSIHPHP